MASCCTGPTTAGPGHCGVCGERGQTVPGETLEHLLKPEKRRGIRDIEYYFCQTPECDIVYFSDAPLHYFDKDDLAVRVGVKEKEDPIPVCYCFDFSERDIIDDLERNGGGRIFQEITANVKAGLCACEIKNPSGRCCLGNVQKAMKKSRLPHALRRTEVRAAGGVGRLAPALLPDS